LGCTCRSEGFLSGVHPIAKDVVLSMISRACDDTLMAAVGHAAEAALADTMAFYTGQRHPGRRGQPAAARRAMFWIRGGKSIVETLKSAAEDATSLIEVPGCPPIAV
jgi:hydrogenase small subunit